MAMQEVVCVDCGAINQWIARACWRCLEPLSELRAEAAEAPETQQAPRSATG